MAQMGTTLLAKFLPPETVPKTDHSWKGDTIDYEKDDQDVRIMFHNVNGLSIRGIDGLDMFANEQANLNVDIQCFSEHCLDTTKYQVYQQAQDILRRCVPGQSSLQLTSSKEPAINIYKPGGTGILILGALVGKQEPQGKGGDSMGR